MVRQAVAYAVPYDKIMSAALYGRGIKLYGGGQAGHGAGPGRSRSSYTTDLVKAKALMAEAGLKDGFETTLSWTRASRSSASRWRSCCRSRWRRSASR